MRLIFIVFIAILLNTSALFSQNELYQELLVGKQYKEGNKSVEGHAFYGDDIFYNCKLYYKDLIFKDLQIKYDIFSQQIIFYQSIDVSIPRFIVLNDQMIDSFVLEKDGENIFFTKKYNNIKGVEGSIKYYQLVYDGNVKYFIGRKKAIQDIPKKEIKIFIKWEYHYLIIDDTLLRIKNKREFFRAFADKKRELKNLARKNKLKIKLKDYNNIKNLLEIYESTM